jgi:RNA polymerase sigma factor (sigma-70 family)
MIAQHPLPQLPRSCGSPEQIDLLATIPSTVPFFDRVQLLDLSPGLEAKTYRAGYHVSKNCPSPAKSESLQADDEKELASEVLLYRHRFTEILLSRQEFRQAALTVVQNIYLFKNRKIFFGNSTASVEQERQEALLLYSAASPCTSLPLEKTFQHLIIARVWSRLISQSPAIDWQKPEFKALHDVVEKLNTLRNIYMLLTTGLVKMFAAKISPLYRESLTYEDAVQIGGMGVARAAYRYHQSCGVRFSTFAANWIFKEIQRQALEGRLIRISANTVESFTKAAKGKAPDSLDKYSTIIENATVARENLSAENAHVLRTELLDAGSSPARSFEAAQLKSLLIDAIDLKLSPKSGDIIKRRYGLSPYQEGEQSILTISKIFGVTRSSIYQVERAALKKLQKYLSRELL